MGAVYKAVDTELYCEVAIKVLSPKLAEQPRFVESFYYEARAAANLSRPPHPNIVVIFEVAEIDGHHCMAMEYVQGKSLRRLLPRGKPWDMGRILHVVRQVADALDYAHDRGVVHRDVKPGNILVTPEGTVKLTDFGIAQAEQFIANPRHSRGLVGTPTYMPPEQVRGDDVDRRADVYSLGIMLYEMLTGAAPFRAETTSKVLDAHLERRPPPVSQVNPKVSRVLARVVDKAIAKDPADRYDGAGELVEALEAAASKRRRMPVVLAPVVGVAAVVVAVLIGAGGWPPFAAPMPTPIPSPTAVAATSTATAAGKAQDTATWTPTMHAASVTPSGTATATLTATASRTHTPEAPTSTVQPSSTATPTETPTVPTSTPAPTDTPSRAPSPTPTRTRAPTDTPSPVPASQVVVTITGLEGDALRCLTLVFFKDGAEVRRVAVEGERVVVSVSADEVKVEGSADGSCPWNHYTLSGADRVALAGEGAVFSFAARGGNGGPPPTSTPW